MRESGEIEPFAAHPLPTREIPQRFFARGRELVVSQTRPAQQSINHFSNLCQGTAPKTLCT